MPFSAFDPVDEERSNQELLIQQEKEKQLKATANESVANRVSSIYKQAPYIPASVILTLAKGGASDAAVDAVKPMAARKLVADMDPQKPEKKGWMERNVWGKAKSAARWTFAGLNLLPDLVQNAAAEVFNPNNPDGMDGFFKSTQLGTMMSNSKQSGSGWFLGGEAAELQAERARRTRGTINNHAWTIGRGAASLAFTPGSKAYNILSGFVDGGVAIVADPTGPLGTKFRNLENVNEALPYLLKTGRGKKLANTIPTISDPTELDAVRALARGEAGLEGAESIAFNQSKFGQWVTTNKRAQFLTNNIVRIASDPNRTIQQKTLDIIESFPSNTMDPQTARAFAEADTVGKVHGLLGEASARLSQEADRVLLPKDVRDIELAKKYSRVFDDGIQRVPLYRSMRNSKFFATMPKATVVINGSDMDKTEAIRNYSNYLKGIGIGPDSDDYNRVMEVVVDAYSATDPTVARPAVQGAFEIALTAIIKKAAGPNKPREEVITSIINRAREEMAQSRVYNADEIGWADDGGYVQTLKNLLSEQQINNLPPGALERIVLQGPGQLSELANEVAILPNFRDMRRLTGALRLATTTTKGGEQRGYLAMIETIQNDIWKPLQLATGGYIMRNMLDSQTRIAMQGISGAFRHPIDYIHWVLNKKGFADIKGEKFDDAIKGIASQWDTEQKEYVEALTFDHYKNLEDSTLAQQRQMRNGNFTLVNRGFDPRAHTTGYVDNIRQLYSDEINRKLAQFSAMGLPTNKRKALVQEWLFSEEGKGVRETLEKYLRNGVVYTDPETGARGVIQVTEESLDQALVDWVDKLSQFKLNTITRNDKHLNIVVGYNKVPLSYIDEAGRRVVEDSVETAGKNIGVGSGYEYKIIEGEGAAGTIVDMGDGKEGLVISRRNLDEGDIDPFTGQASVGDEVVIIQPVHPGTALGDSDFGSMALRNVIDGKGADNVLAQVVKRAERGVPDAGGAQSRALKSWNYAVDKFFVGLNGRATQILEKSPVFRQFYFREVGDMVENLNPAEAQKLLQRIEETARIENIKPENFVGGKDVLGKIRKAASATNENIGTVDELDTYAKAVALKDVKDTLYNATERSNLEDILRVIVPFGPAWKEVIGNYAEALIEDPARVRRAQLIFDAGRKFDPDGDGEGFFYKDPTTGQYSFNFPASGWISKMLTGQEAPMQAPLKQMSIGLGVIPSIGPVAQIAASKIPDTPSTDWIASILLPYGRKEGMTFTPRWLSRLNEAINGNTTNMQTIMGNTYMETLRALSTSGEYDLADINEQNRLMADARSKARVFVALRALGQFIGPTAPTTEFKVSTKEGDMYATQLIKEFQKLQNPNAIGADNQPGNYDTAVKRFIEIYGNDAMLYLSNKTTSTRGGLEATEAFGDWSRNNKDLMGKYPEVAGFMAPGGDNFSFEVWSRQVRKGERKQLTDKELIAAAQYRIGMAQYRELRDKLPVHPSQEQSAWLRAWRIRLNKEYPGFPAVADFNPGKFPKQIQEMKQMLQEPSLQDNETAQSLKEYLDARDEAIAKYVQAGGAEGGFGTANATKPLREWLAGVGKALVDQNPEFARIYDRLLAYEVES